MLARGRCAGAITFMSTVSGRHYGQADVRLAQEVAMRAALAMENARAYEQVQAANRLKDEFLATLSHEMRTPLNAVLGYARMLRTGVIGAERQEQALDVIERNASALTQIVEDVLDVSRIISGKTRLELRPVMLQGVIEDAIATVLPAADAKGVKLDAFLDPQIGAVAGDADRLRQVVWNILSNAVKFTPRGQDVRIRLEASPLQIDIVVADTGIGISSDFLPHIFERFRQAEGGTTRQHGGLGLGLAIARHIVEMHGGTIQAASDGVGKGSTFRVQLPAVAAGRPARVPGRSDEAQARDGASGVAAALEGITVLAVDDDGDARELLEAILEGAGASVTTAASAAEAMDRLTTLRPRVLVADLAMPGEDGYGLIARVRQLADETLRQIPAAAVTACARPEDRARALKSGFSLHLAKPIDPLAVVTAVAVLARRPTPTA
jgi:signal transduction histidine kinase/CheY-like chemotaxis protein